MAPLPLFFLLLTITLGALCFEFRARAEVVYAPVPEVAKAPADNPLSEEKIALGKKLFFDPRLSMSGKVSCSSCHRVTGEPNHIASGTDNQVYSTGIFGFQGDRNSPTVWNAALHQVFFWDGRAKSLEEQAQGPLLNPIEMGLRESQDAVKIVRAIAGYRHDFKQAFHPKANVDTPITMTEITQAIASYERTLLTPDSPFDHYQNGDVTALSPAAVRGWQKFQSFSCIACHGAPTFHNLDYFVRFPAHEAREYDYLYGFTKDEGRYKVTHQFKDRNLWRVPSLRNVAITGPYFHNGSVNSLEQAVRIMGKAQLGRVFSDEDVADLVEFLKGLTGKLPDQKPPVLPK